MNFPGDELLAPMHNIPNISASTMGTDACPTALSMSKPCSEHVGEQHRHAKSTLKLGTSTGDSLAPRLFNCLWLQLVLQSVREMCLKNLESHGVGMMFLVLLMKCLKITTRGPGILILQKPWSFWCKYRHFLKCLRREKSASRDFWKSSGEVSFCLFLTVKRPEALFGTYTLRDQSTWPSPQNTSQMDWFLIKRK